MARIAVLPLALANQIAAGEVVERPASVVKELIENALDAGARRVTVAVEGGGCTRIFVRDDGEGMSREDAALAFARHATSKIRASDDLVSIATFGFRGEALASIAAAADVELLTRRAEDPVGTRVRTKGGSVVSIEDAGAAPGTQIEVRELFGTLPARRKFLRRPATEFGHVAEVVNRLALGRPEVGFVLEHGGRTVLDMPPVASSADRLIEVLGRAAAGTVIRLDSHTAAIRVRGHLGRPEQSLSSARLVLTYVDGRFVRDRLLTRAVLDGFESLLMRGRYPIAVVFLEMARGDVDVNVHPTKAEVRFREPGRVHQQVAGCIAARLREVLAEGPVTAWASQESPPDGGDARGHEPRSGAAALPPSGGAGIRRLGSGAPESAVVVGELREGSLPYGRTSATGTSGRPFPHPDGATGSGAASVGSGGRFAGLRLLGQVLHGYLVCASPRGLVLIDQHAAHERIRFERLRAQVSTGTVAMQQLLVPHTLRLGVRDLRALEDARDALARLGFEGEAFGEETFIVRGIPALLADADCGAVLADLAAELSEVGASRAGEEAVDAVLARVACHSAIRIGRRLEVAEAEALLRSMDEAERSSFCPHGRPAYVELDSSVLERMFKR